MKLSELAIHIPVSVELFEKYNFNYYQNGHQTFKEACEEKGLVFTDIDAELNQLQHSAKSNTMLTLEDMSIDRLIDFINGQHHSNEEEVLQSIDCSIKALLSDPESNNELLLTLQQIDIKFTDFRKKLKKHCEKEDKILFPHMRKLYLQRHDKRSESSEDKKHFDYNSIQLLENEHIEATTILSEIKRLTENYAIPQNASEEYKVFIKKLKDFELEFHMHLHIENNVLFPKIMELEKQFIVNTKSA